MLSFRVIILFMLNFVLAKPVPFTDDDTAHCHVYWRSRLLYSVEVVSYQLFVIINSLKLGLITFNLF